MEKTGDLLLNSFFCLVFIVQSTISFLEIIENVTSCYMTGVKALFV